MDITIINVRDTYDLLLLSLNPIESRFIITSRSPSKAVPQQPPAVSSPLESTLSLIYLSGDLSGE